jgi:4-hydroxy-2-oxoheptanedioate aldolase
MAHYGVAGLVRVDAVDQVPIGRALDLGADGVIVPQVETAEEARLAVAATRYSPSGRRSFGMQTRRVGPFESDPFVVIQIETAGSIEHIEEIAAVDGVDCLYVGPADLGLGLIGRTTEAGAVLDGTSEGAEEMKDAFSKVVDACSRHGIAPGVHCLTGEAARKANEAGFTFTAIAVDTLLVAAGLTKELEAARAGSV